MSRRRFTRSGSSAVATVADCLPQPVTIERIGQGCVIRRHRCDRILRELSTQMHVAAVDPRLGFHSTPWPQKLYVSEESILGTEIYFRAGLEPVVTALLEEAGCTVTIEPRPIESLPAPRPPVGTGPFDPAVLDFVCGRERGLIRLGPGVAPERLVAQIHHAFPDVTIAVAATRKTDVCRFGRRLKARAPLACWGINDDFPAQPGPLVVSTYMGLSDHGVDPHRRQILFALDARAALGSNPDFSIGHFENARLFGFSRIDERLAPYDRDRIWAQFGFDSLDIPHHGRVARSVEVVIGKIAGATPVNCPDPVTLKRGGIWAQPIRNRRIARLATALASGDLSGVGATLPALATRVSATIPSVVVLVEGVEHAITLVQRLPGWKLLAGPHVTARAFPQALRSTSSVPVAINSTIPLRTIATLDGLAEIDLETVDVLVRADGGIGVPATLATGLAVPAHRGSPLILVDWDDRHQPELRRRARDRREAYQALGWSVDRQHAASSPLDQFRATRTQGVQ